MRSSAADIPYFIESFPFILDGLIQDEEHPVWIFYIFLRNILQILLSFSVDDTTIDYLKILITQHHELHFVVFDDTLKPKHHFLLHDPTIMKLIEPITQIWCMRFESKHQFLRMSLE